MAASGVSAHHLSSSEIPDTPESLWLTIDDLPLEAPSGLWESEHSSIRGSWRANEDEDGALCCSLSVSEDAMSEYSESQYGSESGSRRSGPVDSAGASPLTTTTDRSSAKGPRSLPASAYHSSSLASSTAALGATSDHSPSSSPLPIQNAEEADSEPLRSTIENGGVSPKRRGQLKGPRGALRKQNGKGEGLRGGWLGRPAQQPPVRGQVAFQSCLRPGLGGVRTIYEEDEEGEEDEDEEVVMPQTRVQTQAQGQAQGQEKAGASRTIHNQVAAALRRMEEERTAAGGGEEGEDGEGSGPGHGFVRSSSDQSKSSSGGGLSLTAGIRLRGSSDKETGRATRPQLHDGPGCLCPAAVDTPTEASSVADSPPGSPPPERLSTMAVYFCGLPGTGYGRRRRGCALCSRQVGRRAPSCSLCRLVVYCDRRCLKQHEAAHLRSCPGASAMRLREAASALEAQERRDTAFGEAGGADEEEPLASPKDALLSPASAAAAAAAATTTGAAAGEAAAAAAAAGVGAGTAQTAAAGPAGAGVAGTGVASAVGAAAGAKKEEAAAGRGRTEASKHAQAQPQPQQQQPPQKREDAVVAAGPGGTSVGSGVVNASATGASGSSAAKRFLLGGATGSLNGVTVPVVVERREREREREKEKEKEREKGRERGLEAVAGGGEEQPLRRGGGKKGARSKRQGGEPSFPGAGTSTGPSTGPNTGGPATGGAGGAGAGTGVGAAVGGGVAGATGAPRDPVSRLSHALDLAADKPKVPQPRHGVVKALTMTAGSGYGRGYGYAQGGPTGTQEGPSWLRLQSAQRGTKESARDGGEGQVSLSKGGGQMARELRSSWPRQQGGWSSVSVGVGAGGGAPRLEAQAGSGANRDGGRSAARSGSGDISPVSPVLFAPA